MDIALANIRRKAGFARADAESLCRYVRQIEAMPDFETEAESAVSDAETALTEALRAVQLAKSELQQKSHRVTQGVSK